MGGRKEWPGYMQARHEEWLGEMNILIPSTNPYTGVLSYNPDTYIGAIETQMSNLITFYNSIGTTLATIEAIWETLATAVQVKTDSLLLLASTSNSLATIESDLRRFKGGMRDINAVQTSSFILGSAALHAKEGFELVKLVDEMRLKEIMDRDKGVIEGSLQLFNQSGKLAANRTSLFNTYMSKCKVDITAKSEQLNWQVELDLGKAKWPFFEFQQAGNLLGAIKYKPPIRGGASLLDILVVIVEGGAVADPATYLSFAGIAESFIGPGAIVGIGRYFGYW